MSESSFLDRLLDGVEVEWKALGEVLVRTKGTKITASQMKKIHKEGAPLKIFAGGKTVAFVDFKDIPAKDINRKPSIIVKSRGVIEFEYYEQPFSHKNEMWSYHSNDDSINIKYIYHFLKLNEPYFQNLGSRMQMPQISIPDTDKFQIPIPCPENPKKSLEIQAKIVRILDTFTELTTELTTELAARKKQYAYYRDKFLTFEEGEVEWKILGEVGKIIRGNGLQKKDFVKSGFPAIHYGQLYTRYGLSADTTFTYVSDDLAKRLRIADKNDLLIATTSENDEDVLKPLAWLGKKTAISGDMMLLKHGENVKYLAYCFQTEIFQKKKAKYITGTKVRRVSKDNLAKITVPIPYPNDPEKSLAEQARIVAILDKFDTLTHSITEGLPREIELRQKQYEYYRDLLLDFPKEGTTDEHGSL